MNRFGSMASVPHQSVQGLGIPEGETPLFVDLDGTVVKSDLLIESLLALVKREPTVFLSVIGWLFRGRGYIKSKIAERVDINVQTLPYHETFVDFLRAEAGRGRCLYLATASDEKHATSVANHLGMFRGVLASNNIVNLKGSRKLAEIQKITCAGNFDYAGNARADITIWRCARHALLVNPARGVERAARKVGNVNLVFDDRGNRIFAYVRTLRLHQWLKNLLLFVPVLTSHTWSPGVFGRVSVAAFAFSLVASGVYLFNDMFDLESDRLHPQKRKRPFAAGAVPILPGVILMGSLFLVGFSVGSALSTGFLALLGFYLALATAYSVQLKQYVLIDIIVLAMLYTFRIMAGAVAIGVVMSFWLLAFSMFVFISLALIKRCSELVSLAPTATLRTEGRDYSVTDLNCLIMMGTASGYISVLVLALFINSPEVSIRYSNPQVLWLLCPLMLYWISRLWLKTERGEMIDDPIVFALLDRGSRYVLAGLILVVLLATY